MSVIESCVLASTECAGLFRLGRSVEAALDMLDVFEVAASLFEQRPSSIKHQWTQLLMAMLACQQSQDWLGLADSMQYELVELLNT
jgi:hypothetical protein